MFSIEHFIWIALCTALIIVGAVLAQKCSLTMEKALAIFCICCVVSEIGKIFCVLIPENRSNDYGVFIKETDLPFHLCSLQIFFAFYAKFAKDTQKRDFALNFIAPTGALGGVAALLIPTITCSFTNVRTYQYFLYHAALIWFAVTIVLRSGLKFDFRSYGKMLLTLGVVVWITFYINGALQNTNFLYLSEPPMEGLPVLNMDRGWFVYFLRYMGVALTLITLFYLPFWICYAVRKRRIPCPSNPL